MTLSKVHSKADADTIKTTAVGFTELKSIRAVTFTLSDASPELGKTQAREVKDETCCPCSLLGAACGMLRTHNYVLKAAPSNAERESTYEA